MSFNHLGKISISLVLIAIAGLSFFTLSDDEEERLIENYQQVDAHEQHQLNSAGDALLKYFAEQKGLDEMKPDCRGFNRFCTRSEEKQNLLDSVNKVLLISLLKQDAVLSVQLAGEFKLSELELNRGQANSFSRLILNNVDVISSYKEGLASSYNYMGNLKIKEKNYFEAYEFFVKAVIVSEMNKDYFAGDVTTMLGFFGCEQDRMAWGDYHVNSKYTMSGSGTSYPDLPVDEGFDLGIARKSMVNVTEVPELQKKCPINLYKK